MVNICFGSWVCVLADWFCWSEAGLIHKSMISCKKFRQLCCLTHPGPQLNCSVFDELHAPHPPADWPRHASTARAKSEWECRNAWLSFCLIFAVISLAKRTHMTEHKVKIWNRIPPAHIHTHAHTHMHNQGGTGVWGMMQSYTAKSLWPGRGKGLSPSSWSIIYAKELANVDCRREKNYKRDQIYWKRSKISNFEGIKWGC